MKLFYGTSPGLLLNGKSSLHFGETEVHLDESLGHCAGAIVENRLMRADLIKDDAGRLFLTVEKSALDDRVLVVVDLLLHASGWVDYFTVRPNREFVRVLRPHTAHATDSPTHRYHALVILSEATAIRLTETAVSRSFLGRLTSWLGGNPKPVICVYRYRFELAGGEVLLETNHSRG